jgi:hypothetical protein
MHNFSKGRRPWKRGAKLRYSVYKAEDRIEGETDYKGWCERMSEAKGYDVHDFFPDNPHSKHFWEETYDNLQNQWKQDMFQTELEGCLECSRELVEMMDKSDKPYSGRHLEVDKEKVQEAIENLKKLL